jgi:hypothetical protein
MTVSRATFIRDVQIDANPDLSFLGEYSSRPTAAHIDREERGDMGRGEFRYFNGGTGDPGYIGQDYARAEAYNRGDWYMTGVRAGVTLNIPIGNGVSVAQTIMSPGLWGVESDAGDDHIASVYAEECETLTAMLAAMGITVV